MTTRDLALFVHLAGVLTLVAGIAIAGATHHQARNADRAADVAVLLRAARTGVLLAASGGLALLFAGIWLIHLEHLSLHVRWLREAIGLFILGGVLGAAGGRRPRQARELAERLCITDAPITSELRRLLDDRISMVANIRLQRGDARGPVAEGRHAELIASRSARRLLKPVGRVAARCRAQAQVREELRVR